MSGLGTDIQIDLQISLGRHGAVQRPFVPFHVVLSLEADATYIAYPLRRFVYCSTMTPEFVRSTEGSFPTEVAVGLARCGGGV